MKIFYFCLTFFCFGLLSAQNSKKYEIISYLAVNEEEDSIYVREMRFYNINSSFATRKKMFDKFGKWDREVYPSGFSYPVLIWENRKLLPEKNDLFTIVASGKESKKELFSSILIFDKESQNALDDLYPNHKEIKEILINVMSEKENKDTTFFQLFEKLKK